MNSLIIDLIAQSKDYWHLSGDQLFADLDITPENLSVGSQLQIGDAIMEELGKVSRELIKLKKLPRRFNPEKTISGLKEELCDVMYGLVSLANKHQIDLTEALELTVNKFAGRRRKQSG